MATWTTIPDSSLEPGKPIRAIDGLALRDNPVAIAGGAAGAPRIAAAALQTGNNERDWVLERTAGATVGAVGTYAFLLCDPAATVNPGGTRAGSNLRYTSANPANSTSTAPAGTWMCVGFTSSANQYPTVWLRIS
jgi:hypothetical protein